MMFSIPLRAVLIALAATAFVVPAGATTSLKVVATGPGAVNGVEDLKVVTMLTNTGDQTVKLLNHPISVLDTFPADTFTITNEDGVGPDFIGARFKYSPTLAATSTNPSAVTVVAPGKSVSFTHDLSAAYNFTSTGYGTYTVEPSSLLHIVASNNEISTIRAQVESFTANITSGKLVVDLPSITNAVPFDSCSNDQETTLKKAASSAQTLTRNSFTYLHNNAETTDLYRTWFGDYTDKNHGTVLDHFLMINMNYFANFLYDCTCQNSTMHAYVYPNNFGIIHICGAFWPAPTMGPDSQPGTLVHEASHFTINGGTQDFEYGQVESQALARNYPSAAVFNADNHEYFAVNSPQSN